MTIMQVFEQLAKDNGLIIEKMGNINRAWFGDKDFIMGINNSKDYQYIEIATKVLCGKFMLFQPYKNITTELYIQLDKQIKRLIGEFKDFLINEKIRKMNDDFG